MQQRRSCDRFETDALSERRIEERAFGLGSTLPKTFTFTCLSRVDSTNNRIKEAISQGDPEWTTITSLEQEGGYGRQGRTWSSPQGGLYTSLLLRPLDHPEFVEGFGRQHIATLSLALSVAVCRTLAKLGVSEKVHVKWPNDIVCSLDATECDNASEPHTPAKQGKLVGISVEMVSDAVCVGIGINLFRPHSPETPSTKYRPVSVSELLGKSDSETSVPLQGLTDAQKAYMEDALALLLLEVECVYNQWLVEGFPPFRDEYRAKSSLQGHAVQLVSLANDILYEGVVCDVDTDGFLCLTDKDGAIIRAHSGEVHLK